MAIMTVKGILPKDKLGITSTHEHALINIQNQYTGSREPSSMSWEGKVTKDVFDLLMGNPYAIRDNLCLDDKEMAIREVGLAKKAGLQTFVDVTPPDIGRDPSFLLEMSDRTNLNVVAGCGYYTQDTHKTFMIEATEEELAEGMIRELTIGMDGTDIRAGIIGELGTSTTILNNEMKVLHAAARAHQKTGASIMVHLYPWGDNGLKVLDELEKYGVNPERVCICHTDVPLDIPYMAEIMHRGAYLEFDNFGKEFCLDVPYGSFPDDESRLQTMYSLVNQGYLNRLIASCDICLKVLLVSYGGKGYAYVIKDIADRICNHRSDAKMILQALLIENPANYLNNPLL